MKRRTFLSSIFAALVAPIAARALTAIETPRPRLRVLMDELEEIPLFLLDESDRLRQQILGRVMRPSPYLKFVEDQGQPRLTRPTSRSTI